MFTSLEIGSMVANVTAHKWRREKWQKHIVVVKWERILSVTVTLSESEHESDIDFRWRVLFTLSGSKYLSCLHLFRVKGPLLRLLLILQSSVEEIMFVNVWKSEFSFISSTVMCGINVWRLYFPDLRPFVTRLFVDVIRIQTWILTVYHLHTFQFLHLALFELTRKRFKEDRSKCFWSKQSWSNTYPRYFIPEFDRKSVMTTPFLNRCLCHSPDPKKTLQLDYHYESRPEDRPVRLLWWIVFCLMCGTMTFRYQRKKHKKGNTAEDSTHQLFPLLTATVAEK